MHSSIHYVTARRDDLGLTIPDPVDHLRITFSPGFPVGPFAPLSPRAPCAKINTNMSYVHFSSEGGISANAMPL